MHIKWSTQWHAKVIPSGVKQDLYAQSLHPAYDYVLFESSLLQSVILEPHKNHSTPSLVHMYWSFTSFLFFYLGLYQFMCTILEHS